MNLAEAGGGVAYFSLEMPEALLSPRFIASKIWSVKRQEVTYQALLHGEVSDLAAGYARDASEEMKSWPILIEDEPGLTAAEIEARARVIAVTFLYCEYKGRVPTARRQAAEVVKLRSEGMKPEHIASQLGISRASVFRVLQANRSAALPECN